MVGAMLSRVCPRCRLEFPNRYTWKMVWCPFDHCYYCAVCWREGCKPVHGDAPGTRQAYRMLGLVLLVFFGFGFTPFAIALLLTPVEPGAGASPALVGSVILGLFLFGVAWLGMNALVRRLLHRRFLANHPSTLPPETPSGPDPSLSWKPNRAAPPTRVRRLTAAAAALIGVASVSFLAYVLMFAATVPSLAYAVTGLGGILLGLGATLGLFALLPIASPSAIAIAPDGVHFWYDSPLDRRTQTDVMKWTQLNVLAMQAPAAGDAGTRLVRMFRIDAANAQEVLDAWKRHRLAPPPFRPSSVTPPIAKAPSPEPVVAPPPSSGTGRVLPSRATPRGRGRRGQTCARCHIRFPGLEGLRLYWCKVDRFYVCRRCWEDGCGEGHGRGMKAVSKSARIASAVLIVAVFLALVYPAFAYDYTLTSAWNSDPVSSISTLQAGQLVKVRGFIVSDSSVAFGGYEIQSKNGWYWEWDSNDLFTLYDGVGSILVSTAEWYIIYNGPDYAPNAYYVQVGVYGPGDIVQIVGTVVRGPTGALELDAQIMSLVSAVPLITLAPSPVSSAMSWILPIAIVATLAAGFGALLRRRIVHDRATKGQPSYSISDSGETRDPQLDWRPNGRGTAPRRRAIYAGIAVLIGVAFLAVYPGFAPRPSGGMSGLAFIGSVVLMFEAFVVYLLLFGAVGHPSFVAAADDGFRMWFDSPYDRHLSDTVFPWDQIQNIYLTGGKNQHWVLRWTTGEVTNLYMLKGKNLNLLLEEWTRRRMPADA